MEETTYCVTTKIRTDVKDFLTDLQAKDIPEPLLFWVEPAPGFHAGCNWCDPIERSVFGEKGWPKLDFPLDEARLFWKHSALHVVADVETGCRVAEYGEGDPDIIVNGTPQPDWIKQESSPEQKIILRRDLERFGFHKTDSPMYGLAVRVVGYLKDGVLVGWRLLP